MNDSIKTHISLYQSHMQQKECVIFLAHKFVCKDLQRQTEVCGTPAAAHSLLRMFLSHSLPPVFPSQFGKRSAPLVKVHLHYLAIHMAFFFSMMYSVQIRTFLLSWMSNIWTYLSSLLEVKHPIAKSSIVPANICGREEL